MAASHAARISAANRRYRNERAAVDTRASALIEEMANRRRLTVKFMALQVQVGLFAIIYIFKRVSIPCFRA